MATIHGVPELISRPFVLHLLRRVGLDVNNLVDLTLDRKGLHATVFALDDNGRKIISTDSPITHKLFIRFEDTPA